MYRRWMKTFFFSEFFKRLVFLEMRQVILFFTWLKISNFLTLKLLAVILSPTGTVYRLLGDKWRQPEERRQFDCHKAILTSGSKSQAFVVVNISPRQSHSNGCPVGFPGESRHLSFSLVAASWTSSGCRSDHPQLLILPSGSVGTFHGGKYLHDVILTQSSFHTSPKVRNRVSDSRTCVFHLTD